MFILRNAKIKLEKYTVGSMLDCICVCKEQILNQHCTEL